MSKISSKTQNLAAPADNTGTGPTALKALGHDPSAAFANPHASLIHDFDLNALRLPQNFSEAIGVTRQITRVPVRKPQKSEFFRVHSGETWRLQTMLLELKEESETYVVLPGVWDALPDLIKPAVLHSAVDRKGNFFLIPVPMPTQDGRRNSWHDSLNSAVIAAESNWVRVVANLKNGGYDLFVANGDLPGPDWPESSFSDLVNIAFKNRIISAADHPVVKQLTGEI